MAHLFDDGESSPDYRLRQPCRWCGATTGEIRPKGGQSCVYCNGCGRMVYNAPKSETGAAVRSVRSRPDIKPSTKARIHERDNYRCTLCGAGGAGSGVNLHIGHMLSIEDGRIVGATEAQLSSDENLATWCEECNLGQGSRSVSVRLVYQVLCARLKQPSGWTE